MKDNIDVFLIASFTSGSNVVQSLLPMTDYGNDRRRVVVSKLFKTRSGVPVPNKRPVRC